MAKPSGTGGRVNGAVARGQLTSLSGETWHLAADGSIRSVRGGNVGVSVPGVSRGHSSRDEAGSGLGQELV
jgi:hypothetical protein